MTLARRRSLVVLAAVLFVAVLVGGRWAALETAERAWAATVAGGDVYLRARDLARLVRGLVLLGSVTWGTAHLYWVYRTIGSVQMPRRLGDLEIAEAIPRPVLLGLALAGGLLYGFVLAWGSGDWWPQAVLAGAPPSYGVRDPVLARDLGYYLAQLPWARTRQGFAFTAALTATALAAALYAGMGSLRFRRWRPVTSDYARRHLAVLLVILALTAFWGALLDPAELVAGFAGPLDGAAIRVRIPGAGVVAALAVGAALVSALWAWRDWSAPLTGAWGALVIAALGAYAVLPAIARSAGTELPAAFAATVSAARDQLSHLAIGLERVDERAPPEYSTLPAAAAGIPLWDPPRVAATVRATGLLDPHTTVDGVALVPGGARPAWLVTVGPDDRALSATRPVPSWLEIHAGAWAHSGGPWHVAETDTGLVVTLVPAADTAAWFGAGFTQFAVADPTRAPAVAAAGVALVGTWRRLALVWTLQSLELARNETDGLVLLWRRGVATRLGRLAPFARFETPSPVVIDGAVWWLAYGYLEREGFPLVRPVTRDRTPLRYRRAALVGAVSAAAGDTRLYLAPGHDALAAAWGRLYAPLVQPAESLPPALRGALTFPAETFALAGLIVQPVPPDTVAPRPRPAAPFHVVARLGPALWAAQGFERPGAPPALAALVAGTMAPDGPRLARWRPAADLPTDLVGAGTTHPGVFRLWPAAGALLTLQARFEERGVDGAPPVLESVFASWGDRHAVGSTLTDVLQRLARGRPASDTTSAARLAAARRLAEQADAALRRGDFAEFGRLYQELRRMLGAESQLAPARRPD